MLLAIDIGNTTISIGLFETDALGPRWRLASSNDRTADEYGILLTQLLERSGVRIGDVREIALASVVPPLTGTLERACRDYLGAAPLVGEYGAALGKMGTVQKSIPSIWPIKGGIGHISTLFGYETNVFTGQRYFHQGIDCSTYRRGDPIVATADGKVGLTANDRSYGLTVIIAHDQGFSTRYGHMDRLLVRTGQSVKQGETIGILGNTGVSTGPHIHYEVMIGDKRTDPMNFLWLRKP